MEVIQVEACATVKTSLEDRREPLQGESCGLIEVLGPGNINCDRSLSLFTLGRLCGCELFTFETLLLSELLTCPLLVVIASLRHADPPRTPVAPMTGE